MEGIDIEKKVTEYFFRVVNKSICRHRLVISEEVKAYVVFLVEKFYEAQKFFPGFSNPLTFRLHEADDTKKLQEIADQCLFLTGYFRDYVKSYGSGQIGYVSDLGSSAYRTVGERKIQPIFFELAHKFPDLSLVVNDFHNIQLSGEITEEEIKKFAKALEALKGKGLILPRNDLN